MAEFNLVSPSLYGTVPVVSASSHEGASVTDKSMVRWTPMRLSADADQLHEQGTLVSRSRDIARNNGPASGAKRTFRDHIIGTGLRLVSTPDYRALGKDKDWAQGWSDDVEAIFRDWSESFFCDAGEGLLWRGLSGLVLDDSFQNGEALALPLWMPGTRSSWNTRILLVEADRLSNPQDAPDSEFLRGGIEIDRYGKALAYHVRKTHPGDQFLGYGVMYAGAADWERIPAETDWGRKRVVHVHAKERTGQTRGKPWYTPILPDFKRLDQFQKATIKSAVVRALIATFIKTPLDPVTLAQTLGADITSEKYQDWLLNMRQYTAPLEGGATIPLPPGTEPVPFTPNLQATDFAQFCLEIDKNIAAGLNMPVVLYKKDFSQTNYSSARAALLEAYRHFNSQRQWLADYWAKPCFTLVLEEAVNKGWIDAPDFYDNIAAYTRCGWIGPPRGWVDPVKEIEAAGLRMETNISTLEIECAEQGRDWKEVLEQTAVEQAYRAKLGLPAPQPVSRAASGQPPQETNA